jgi:hypothetical protein
MTLFNFFRKSVKEVTTTAEEVDANLFADPTPPVTDVVSEVKNALPIFLGQDYSNRGFNDGYLYATAEVLEASLRKLRSDFRRSLDEDMDKKRAEISELRLHGINTKGVSERIDEMLAEKIKQQENLIQQLDIQKTYSVADEGMISSVLHDYKIGYIKGMEQYSREEFLCGSTGLFNS